MTLSLNEVAAEAKKAARGAGYPWGIAEEAAKAVRWLCARDLDGCGALVDLLDRVQGEALARWAPRIGGDVWDAEAGTLCPLQTGAALSDRAAGFPVDGISTGRVACPILLAPFASHVAETAGQIVSIAWSDAEVSVASDRLHFEGRLTEMATSVDIRLGGTVSEPQNLCQRAAPDEDVWTRLAAYAHRTYAPATEASRLKGAGAGLSDND